LNDKTKIEITTLVTPSEIITTLIIIVIPITPITTVIHKDVTIVMKLDTSLEIV
jgi:hypothetical protein